MTSPHEVLHPGNERAFRQGRHLFCELLEQRSGPSVAMALVSNQPYRDVAKSKRTASLL